MNIAISGSRRFSGDGLPNISQYIDTIYPEFSGLVLLHGACPQGVDSLVDKIFGGCPEIEIRTFSANWDKHGKKAGPMRNEIMVQCADALIAYPDKQSVGTWDTVTRANRKRIPVIIHPIGGWWEQ